MPNRKYKAIPPSVCAEIRLRWQTGETSTSIATDLGIDAGYVSRIARGKARETAPGPVGQSRPALALSTTEQDEILSAVVYAHKHFDGPASRRAVAKAVGRNRDIVARVTRRADAWVTRLFKYIKKGAGAGDCWEWTGGTFTAARKSNGTVTQVEIPRFMNGPNRGIQPARFMFAFTNGLPRLKGRFVRTCRNNLCVNPSHHRRPARTNQEAAR
jgi:hypothetical protein